MKKIYGWFGWREARLPEALRSDVGLLPTPAPTVHWLRHI